MRTVFGSWKYIFRNLWFLLSFAVIPAVFMALSLDYRCISEVVCGYFTGTPQAEFLEFFHAWSFIRFDSVLGAVYSLLAVVCIFLFMAALLAFVEKHMKLGKRTFGGVAAQFKNVLLPALFITLLYVVLYEIWAVVLSAVLYVISQVDTLAVAYLLYTVAVLLFLFVLIYLATMFYLWLPCKQMTGFRFFDAFLYSYRLMVGVRGKLLLSFAVSVVGMFLILVLCSLLPYAAYHIIAVILFFFLFLNFGIRMEALYFETDKLDREDILRHKWEY